MAVKNMTYFQSNLMALACECQRHVTPPPVCKHFLANMLVTKEPLDQLAVSGIVKTLHAAENQNKQGRSCTRGHSFYATISFLCFAFFFPWVLLSSGILFLQSTNKHIQARFNKQNWHKFLNTFRCLHIKSQKFYFW